ncbi:MAG: universal stress protein [Deltaproteobacteria bacterium]|nr:universal stress protein [Deltaproteobacteria bacterium]
MDIRILIPVDGSKTAARTLEKIVVLKEHFPKKLTLLHVVDVDKLAYRMIPDFQIDMIRDNAGKAGHQVLNERSRLLEEAGFQVDMRLEFGSPRQTICKIANQEDFDLAVIGRRETTGEIRDVLFGSIANYVLHNVKCPVLLF